MPITPTTDLISSPRAASGTSPTVGAGSEGLVSDSSGMELLQQAAGCLERASRHLSGGDEEQGSRLLRVAASYLERVALEA